LELSNLLEHAPSRPPTVEPDPDRTAVLQPTGGTTGTLKLAELTHRSLLANAAQSTTLMGSQPGQERIMAVLPLFHVYGLTTCLTGGIYSAATLILATRFQAGPTLELLREHKPTIFPLVPAICDALSNELEREADGAAPEPLHGLKLCLSGAAPLPEATAVRFQRLTGAQVVEGYGLTEASPVTHVNPPAKLRAGSIGLPLPDTRVRVVDLETGVRDVVPGEPGEMLISGPQVMSGYFANPDQTDLALHHDSRGDAWLRTGDVVRYDEDGYFYVMDRRKDMIIRSGMKVYPARVEKVLSAHPRVAEVGVVGRPDPVHTETVVAVMALTHPPADRGKAPEPDHQQLADELRGMCREHLAPYEVPGVFEFVDKLPRSPLGKLLKRELRKPPVLPVNGDRANGDGHANHNGNGRGGWNGKH
jgi:long-chain acyl-CoA synthetase